MQRNNKNMGKINEIGIQRIITLRISGTKNWIFFFPSGGYLAAALAGAGPPESSQQWS
jgi:hypothetical protein